MRDKVYFHTNSNEKDLIKGLYEANALVVAMEFSLRATVLCQWVTSGTYRSEIIHLEKNLVDSQANLTIFLKANGVLTT